MQTELRELRTEMQTAATGFNARLDNGRRRAHNMVAKGMPVQAPQPMLLQALAKERQPVLSAAVVGDLPADFPATYAAARKVRAGQHRSVACARLSDARQSDAWPCSPPAFPGRAVPLIDPPASLHFPQLTHVQLDQLAQFYEEQFAGANGACSGPALLCTIRALWTAPECCCCCSLVQAA